MNEVARYVFEYTDGEDASYIVLASYEAKDKFGHTIRFDDAPDADMLADEDVPEAATVSVRYYLDAEWSNDLVEFDHLPSKDEVREIHESYLETQRDMDALRDLEEQTRQVEEQAERERDAEEEEKRLAWDLDHQRLLSVAEVAALKGCSEVTVRRALRNGEFARARSVGVGQRKVWLLDAEEAKTWQVRPVGRPAQS